MKLNTIVVGVDGSSNARRALEAAISLGGPDTTVHLVTAYDRPAAHEVDRILAMIPDEFRTTIDLLETPRGHLRVAEKTVRDKGLDCTAHFVEDKPAAAILDTADAVDADLIVVGSRGLGRATRFARGSVSTRVASHATRSFLVIHEDDDK